MNDGKHDGGVWSRLPVIVRAVIVGLLVGLLAANVWLPLLFGLGMPLAAGIEALFLGVYVWWASGGGPPKSLKAMREASFRGWPHSASQWLWGLIAAVFFAATVHASIVVLFRFVAFPAAEFHAGYDLSVIPDPSMRWLAVVISAVSAGVCEEIGFRGYMQRPIEKRHGPFLAILISALVFMLVHLTKSWSTIGMVPIVFGAGLLLGTLARASGTLVFCMIGHTIMDIGLFAYWWTQIAGTFSQRPISETGMDQVFYADCSVLAVALVVTIFAIARLRRLREA